MPCNTSPASAVTCRPSASSQREDLSVAVAAAVQEPNQLGVCAVPGCSTGQCNRAALPLNLLRTTSLEFELHV